MAKYYFGLGSTNINQQHSCENKGVPRPTAHANNIGEAWNFSGETRESMLFTVVVDAPCVHVTSLFWKLENREHFAGIEPATSHLRERKSEGEVYYVHLHTCFDCVHFRDRE